MREVKKKVDQGIMIKPQYQIFKSEGAGSFETQLTDCLNRFQLFLEANPDQKPFITRVFIAADDQEQFSSRSKWIKQQQKAMNVPISVLAEAPELPDSVLIEAGFVSSFNHQVEYGKAAGISYCKIKSSGCSEYWLAGVEGEDETLADNARNAFARLLQAFLQLGIDFNQIYRQWNYVEQIFGIQEIEGKSRQNYQVFNEARAEYYSKYRTVSGFPAATGIGTAFNGVTIECMAVECDDEVKTIAISNPKQTNSYKYGQEVLKGEPQKNCKQNQAPQFERARLMTNGVSSRLFVSGTASIIGQETIGIGDVEMQTRVTIANLQSLVSEENLRAHYLELNAVPDRYACVRVYVKNGEDIPVVKAICSGYFRNVPVTFVQANICRADLLVEIEAEMVN
jgi:Putative translation initiation inhibitor, yjgF family